MTCGVYRIVSTCSGKCYVGSSKNIEARWKSHRSELRAGKHSNFKLAAAWTKYGQDGLAFEILELTTPAELRSREVAWIAQFNSYKDGYNCSPLGAGATEATALKVSAANRRRKGVKIGNAWITEEGRKKRSETMKATHAAGKFKMTPERRAAISAGVRRVRSGVGS